MKNIKVDFKTYTKNALGTAIYPRNCARRYTYYGFMGEVGELSNKIKKSLRGDYSIKFPDCASEKNKDLSSEIGDICWYLACYCYEHGIELGIMNLTLNDNQGFYSTFDSLLFKVGKLSTQHSLTPDISNLAGYSRSIFRLLGQLAYTLGFDIRDVLSENTLKLLDRKKRGVIKGSGDNR